MKSSYLYALWAAASLLTFQGVSSSPLVVHEERTIVGGLKRGSRLDSTSKATFSIALKQSNLDKLDQYLHDVSSPYSDKYSKHWSYSDVRRAFAPSQESFDIVNEWLAASGIEDAKVSRNGGSLTFESTIGDLEKVLGTEYHEFEDEDGESLRIGCEQYKLPEHVSQHVDYIKPGVSLSKPLKKTRVEGNGSSLPGLPRSRPAGLGPWARWSSPSEPENSSSPIVPRSSSLPKHLHQCSHKMTPDCLRALYGIPSPEEIASSYTSDSANPVGVFSDFGTYRQKDYDEWFPQYASQMLDEPFGLLVSYANVRPKGTHTVVHSINGARHREGQGNPETALDTMVLYGLVYPQTITLYEVQSTINGSSILTNLIDFSVGIEELLDAIDQSFCPAEDEKAGSDCGTYPPTRVINISYGVAEIDAPEAYLQRQCAEFGKLGLQGITFVVASGDTGVAPTYGYRKEGEDIVITNGCIKRNDFNATAQLGQNLNGTVFHGAYPATCPWITAIGGTILYADDTIVDAESAMYISKLSTATVSFSPGGGFSNYFSRPKYQAKTVNKYLKQHNPGYPTYSYNGIELSKPGNNIGAHGGLYNRDGRAFPDVSANGVNFPIIYYNKPIKQHWTSQAAPIYASMFTLINEKRTEAGKGPVGFVNPVLYAHPEVFNDITNGTNPGCFTEGFAAVEGWDPVTGLGTPNYPKLLELFLSLP